MHAAFPSQGVPADRGLYRHFNVVPAMRCWPSIETPLGEFHVSARVLTLMLLQHSVSDSHNL